MIQTDIDIRDALYTYITGSELARAVSGAVSKTIRPRGSRREDVVISVLANDCDGDIQMAIAQVNIYVAGQLVDDVYEEDTERTRELARIASEVLARSNQGVYLWELTSQRILPIEGTSEYLINNRIKYKHVNE